MSDTANAGPSVESAEEEHAADGVPINPYFVALWIVMVGCAVTGFILLSIGNGLASTFAHQTFGTIKDTGIGQLVWGGALLGLAVTTAIVMLGAAAARWRNDE